MYKQLRTKHIINISSQTNVGDAICKLVSLKYQITCISVKLVVILLINKGP